LNKNKKQIKKRLKTKFIVNENFNGTKKPQDIFSDIIMSEHVKNKTANFTRAQQNDIIGIADSSQISGCSRKE
jgi:hypothetical protein